MDTPLTRLLKTKLNAVLGGNESELARLVGTSQQNINNYLTGRVRKPQYRQAVNKVLGIRDDEWLTTAGISVEPNAKPQGALRPPASAGQMVPVLGEAVGVADGVYLFNGTVLDYVACPPSLKSVLGAYAVFIYGESMSPRYRPGETVWVHPRKPARHGDDVIVQTIPPDGAGFPPLGYVKEFVGWQENRLILRQYSPDGRLEFDRTEVLSVHPIVLASRD
ncbi:S24 family peptidase [Rhizobium sp. 0TCS1.26]|uniref:S24 family peptidase n=1 Tax=Rhizobium sp. 0TCS1.26 TaxID=3142623 RepID=UPI003D2AA883